MSTNIPGRGKQRKHGQDLNSNAMSMGGGQMVMPPNGAAAPFATPIVNQPHQPHAPEGYRAYGNLELQQLQQPPVSGSNHPTMVVPTGMNVQQEQTSQYANMQGLPQNMRGGAGQVNPNMQWGMPQQQQHMPMQMASVQMNRGPQQQGRYNGQQTQQQMGYYPAVVPQGGFYMQPAMYPQQYTQEQAYAAAQAYAQQQQQQQQYYQQAAPQMMQQQQQHQQHMVQQQQQHQGGVAPAMQTMQAPPALQQQQQGGGAAGGGGAAAGAATGGFAPHAQQQQQSMHGEVPPSGGQPMHPGTVPVTAPQRMPPQSSFNPLTTQQQQQQQPRNAAPPAPKTKKILLIVDPNTQKAINEDAIEESKREEDAPKAEKEEAKGTDETDSAAPEVKKQFAAAILEQTTKSEQPAPAPATVPAVKERKSLFSAEQIKALGLENKVAHIPLPPVPAPPAAAAPAAVKQQPENSEFLPEPLAAPAYPNNYKEKQAKEEATPDDAEMPAVNNDEQPDDSHVMEVTPQIEEPASSSSDKNTSNDSAICVQTPVTPPPPTEAAPTVLHVEEEKEKVPAAAAAPAADEVVVEEEAEKEEAEEEQPVAEAEPLVKKLEQLVIAESASQEEEGESEPSTPAPVTPSMSETAATVEEEEEDAEKAAAAAEEERQRKRAELEGEIAKNLLDLEQFNEEIGWYNREYLYNVRDIEKMFGLTPCPLTPEELKNFGICRSLVSNEPKRKQDGQGGFMPGWARQGGGGGGGRGGHDRKQAYQGRQSEQHHRGGGGGGRGSNKKLPPSIRPSIERRVDTNVQLHKAEKAWKPEKVTETDESEETKKKLLLKTIRALFNKITPTTKDSLINEFLIHKVYESTSLPDVISIIFDKAVEEPKFCPLYASMCQIQVAEELKLNNNVSNFRNAILVRAQETFTTKNQDDLVKEKEAEIETETDEKKKKEKKIELLETQSKFRRRKFGNITFIGQLYLQNLISVRIILFCVVDLLKSVTDKPADLTGYEADEESIDCAVRLLETIGKRLQEEANRAAADAKNAAAAKTGGPKTIVRNPAPAQPPKQTFPIDMTFQTLESAIPFVSSRIKFMIMNLGELRRNGWVPRKTADAGPKKLDEIKKEMQREQVENLQAAQAYDRKQSRQEGGPMGGRGGPMGGGGGGGHGGNNPKRMIIQRNSSDRGTVEDRRSQAFKASNLGSRSTAPPKKNASLSSVTSSDRASLGGKKENKWSGGASGGSENSRKEERSAAIQSTSRFMAGNRSSSAASMKGAEDEGANASGNATQANSEDEREQNEQREKQEADITKRCTCDVGDYGTAEISLDEVREEVFKIVGAEKFSKPSLQTVFKCFMDAAVKKAPSDSAIVPKFGHVLAYCLLKKAEEKDTKGREEILKGVADCFRDIVEQEKWEDTPKIWDYTAEVLINAHLPDEGLFVGAHPTLTDFKDSFLNAAKDESKPYALFVLVLKRLAEMHYKRDKESFMEAASWVLDECPLITKHMDEEKLNKALKATKMTPIAEDLHVIMRQEH